MSTQQLGVLAKCIHDYIPVANCGHPNLLPINGNDSVPNTEGYDDITPVEGSTIRSTHPPGLSLVLSELPNTATCTENGEWENQTQDLSCAWVDCLLLTLNSLITLAFSAYLSVCK